MLVKCQYTEAQSSQAIPTGVRLRGCGDNTLSLILGTISDPADVQENNSIGLKVK